MSVNRHQQRNTNLFALALSHTQVWQLQPCKHQCHKPTQAPASLPGAHNQACDVHQEPAMSSLTARSFTDTHKH